MMLLISAFCVRSAARTPSLMVPSPLGAKLFFFSTLALSMTRLVTTAKPASLLAFPFRRENRPHEASCTLSLVQQMRMLPTEWPSPSNLPAKKCPYLGFQLPMGVQRPRLRSMSLVSWKYFPENICVTLPLFTSCASLANCKSVAMRNGFSFEPSPCVPSGYGS